MDRLFSLQPDAAVLPTTHVTVVRSLDVLKLRMLPEVCTTRRSDALCLVVLVAPPPSRLTRQSSSLCAQTKLRVSTRSSSAEVFGPAVFVDSAHVSEGHNVGDNPWPPRYVDGTHLEHVVAM